MLFLGQVEKARGFFPPHFAAGAVRTGVEALGVTQAADQVAAAAHRARDDSPRALFRQGGALAMHEDTAAEVFLQRGIIVVDVEFLQKSRAKEIGKDLSNAAHHQGAVSQGKLTAKVHGLEVFPAQAGIHA